VMDPGKSLQDDAKFGKALVKGFVEPYKKSWAEGKYFEVAGRATFDIGSLFIGAGEANAAIKTGEVASVAGKTAEVASVASKAGEVANVASKAGEVANVASRAGKVANVASKAGKAAEVASATGKTAEAVNVASKTGKVSEATSATGKASEAANVTGKTEKAAEVASTTGKTTEVTSDASRTAKTAKSEAEAAKSSSTAKTGEEAATAGKGSTHRERTAESKSSIENKGYDKSKTFRSDADPLHDTYGPAHKSHPEEFDNTIRELENAGVEVDFRPGNLGCSPAKNNPGRFIFDPEASVGALRHEMRHFKDIRDAGYPGIGPYLENPSSFWKMEYRGYMEEVNFARQNRDFSNARKILDIMRARKKEILGGI
jgi:hypothetical protein